MKQKIESLHLISPGKILYYILGEAQKREEFQRMGALLTKQRADRETGLSFFAGSMYSVSNTRSGMGADVVKYFLLGRCQSEIANDAGMTTPKGMILCEYPKTYH